MSTLFAESDDYVRELMREARGLPAADPLPLQRRSFLMLAGATSAGLVLGFYLPNDAHADTETPQTAREASTTPGINAFVRIAPDNVITIYSKAPEIGQGIKTSFGLIIAEELDADWNHVVIEQAPINTKIYGYQGAGGSTSIPRAWDQLRQAGAGAKAMLIAAAAKKWNVNPAEITAQDSRLTHQASERSATYGSLVAEAAKMPVPDPKTLKLKTRDQYRLLGRRQGDADRRRRQEVERQRRRNHRKGFDPQPCRQRQKRDLWFAGQCGGEDAGARSRVAHPEDAQGI